MSHQLIFQKVIEAIKSNDLPQLQDILGNYVFPINSRCQNGATALHVACMFGNVDIARVLLLDYNANPNRTDSMMRTPLMYLIDPFQDYFDRCSTARLLLSRGANVHARDRMGNTALHLACYKMSCNEINSFLRLDIVEELLEHDADMTLINDAGETPWDAARSDEHLKRPLIDLLIQYHPKRQDVASSVSTSNHHTSSESKESEFVRDLSALTSKMEEMDAHLMSKKLESIEQQLLFSKVYSLKEEVSDLKYQLAKCLSLNKELHALITDQKKATTFEEEGGYGYWINTEDSLTTFDTTVGKR